MSEKALLMIGHHAFVMAPESALKAMNLIKKSIPVDPYLGKNYFTPGKPDEYPRTTMPAITIEVKPMVVEQLSKPKVRHE